MMVDWQKRCSEAEREREEARRETQDTRRWIQQRGQEIADALGRRRGTQELVPAVRKVMADFDKTEAALAQAQEALRELVRTWDAYDPPEFIEAIKSARLLTSQPEKERT